MDLGRRGRKVLQFDGSSSHPEVVLVSPGRPHRILGTGKNVAVAWATSVHLVYPSAFRGSDKHLRRSTHKEERFIWLPSWEVPFHNKRDIREGF